MDFERLKHLSDLDLKKQLSLLSRSEMDDEFRLLRAQRAALFQKLESVLGPGREALAAAIHPGGLEEIDQAIRQAAPEAHKERALLQTYRDFNRILLHFMDAYEERVMGDFSYRSTEELQTMLAAAEEEKKRSTLKLKNAADDRKRQDEGATLRLIELFKAAIHKELQNRLGDAQ